MRPETSPAVLLRVSYVITPMLILIAAAGNGCDVAPAIQTADSTPGEDLSIYWEKSGTYSRLGRSVRVLARDEATLAQVPVTEVPVDWKTQMVLVAGLGPTPTSDVGLRITRVWREGPRIRVLERQIHPGTEKLGGLNPASPWTVVVIPRSDLNVEGYSVNVPRGVLTNRFSGGGRAGGASTGAKPSARPKRNP